MKWKKFHVDFLKLNSCECTSIYRLYLSTKYLAHVQNFGMNFSAKEFCTCEVVFFFKKNLRMLRTIEVSFKLFFLFIIVSLFRFKKKNCMLSSPFKKKNRNQPRVNQSMTPLDKKCRYTSHFWSSYLVNGLEGF